MGKEGGDRYLAERAELMLTRQKNQGFAPMKQHISYTETMKVNTLYPFIFLFLTIILLAACQAPPPGGITTDEFVLQEGFAIDLVASEPLLASPMAMTFDLEGRIWVVEMPGYMRDINGSDEQRPDGRIVILSDKDKDGRMDQRTLFIDSLVLPRAVSLAYGGLLYTDQSKLWWVAIDGDQPGQKVLVDSVYVVGGNIEHQPNGLLYNLDNWLYSAKSNARYRLKDGKWLKEPTSFRGQWGISHDNEGRLFYNSNSSPLKGDYTTPNQFIKNPFLKPEASINQTIHENTLFYPIKATSINRGYVEGQLDSLGKAKAFTSACGPVIYKGDQFPPEFQGNAFVCGPEGNLVKRYILQEDQVKIKGKNAYQSAEFLVSTEESFRPVNLYNGLDGSLYILDLRKGVIQHKAYMSSYLRDQMLSKGLDEVNGLGRIYKVTAKDRPQNQAPDFSHFLPKDYLPLLQHANGQLRSQAQQYLVFGKHTELAAGLQGIALDESSPYGQIHALWTLEGLDLLDNELLLQVSQKSNNPIVFSHLLQLATLFPAAEKQLLALFQKARQLSSPKVDLQLCHSLGQFNSPESQALFLGLAQQYSKNPSFCEALISGIHGKEQIILDQLLPAYADAPLVEMLRNTLDNIKANKLQAPKIRTEVFEDGRTKAARLYSTFCATCHGEDGRGMADIAPPLYESEYVTSSAEQLILIVLNGLYGPITVNGKAYELNSVMPGIKNNPELSDDDIAALLRFVSNGFNSTGQPINGQKVKKIRQMTADLEDVFTVESLKQWMLDNLGEDKALD